MPAVVVSKNKKERREIDGGLGGGLGGKVLAVALNRTGLHRAALLMIAMAKAMAKAMAMS